MQSHLIKFILSKLINKVLILKLVAELEVEMNAEKAAITDLQDIIRTEKMKNLNLREQMRARSCRCATNPPE